MCWWGSRGRGWGEQGRGKANREVGICMGLCLTIWRQSEGIKGEGEGGVRRRISDDDSGCGFFIVLE